MFVRKKSGGRQTTQRARDAIITSLLRNTTSPTSCWRSEDVIVASLLRYVSVGHWCLLLSYFLAANEDIWHSSSYHTPVTFIVYLAIVYGIIHIWYDVTVSCSLDKLFTWLGVSWLSTRKYNFRKFDQMLTGFVHMTSLIRKCNSFPLVSHICVRKLGQHWFG